MTVRPIFIPDYIGPDLFQEKPVEFEWFSGFSKSQKLKNIKSLHESAIKMGFTNILEISTKSEHEIGRRLSAFNLKYSINGTTYPLESVYQGSKVFIDGGPYENIFGYEPREAKNFIRNRECGNLIEFRLEGKKYPLSPPNAFYDWLYIRSIENQSEWVNSLISNYDAFTDIEYNPKKQFNCQARSFASYLSLLKRGNLSRAQSDFNYYMSLIAAI